MKRIRSTLVRLLMFVGACVAALSFVAFALPPAVHASTAHARANHAATTTARLVAMLPGLAPLAATFVVNDTGDASDASIGDSSCATAGGVCTLRAALEEANATPATDGIGFGIAGAGPHTITPASPLVATQPVEIDGTTQPGASCAAWPPTLAIMLNGASVAAAAGNNTVLSIAGGNSLVRGLVFNNTGDNNADFSVDIALGLDSNTNRVECNYIGTDATGTAAMPNETGVAVNGNATIVGTNGDGVSDLLERNLISGNNGIFSTGVTINGNNNRIAGNYIGSTPDGMAALANQIGIEISAGTANIIGTNSDGVGDALERNVISGNAIPSGFFSSGTGISIYGSSADNNRVSGNYIGTDASGTGALSNGAYGISIRGGADGNVIGTDGDGSGDAVEGNVISGNAAFCARGITIDDSSSPAPDLTSNVIAGNRIGLDINGNTLGNCVGIGLGNRAVSTRIGTDGDGTSDVLERNYISGSDRDAISLGGQPEYGGHFGTTIAGNFIGVGLDGVANRRNSGNGIYIQYLARDIVIGTNGDGVGDAAEGNVISYNSDGFCNSASGIRIRGLGRDETYNIRIAGNKIGTTAEGATAAANANSGISIESGARDILIGTNGDGTSDALEGNLISGHALNNGSCSPDSERAGVVIDGTLTAPDNVSSRTITIAGNKIGTDISGTAAIANGFGIVIRNGSSGNVIGTNGDGAGDAAEGNLISGNANAGISLSGTPNTIVAGNVIGLQPDGIQALGNGPLGMLITGANTGTRIGTDVDGTSDALERNVIAAHTAQGMRFAGASGVLVQGNAIGTRSDGTDGNVGNVFGIGIEGGSTGNQIGTSAVGNTIAYNTTGIFITQSTGNDVAGNTIADNATYGIQNYLTESVAPGDGPSDNTITANTVTQSGVGIHNIGASPTISSNTIADNRQNGIFNGVFLGNDASPATANDDVLSRPQIASNTFTNNCTAAGAGACASIASLDTMPANESTLESDNSLASVAAGSGHVRQSWYGAVEIIQSGTPIAASTTIDSSNGGPAYAMNNASSCSGVLNNTTLHGVSTALNCANVLTWTEIVQYVVDASGTRIVYVPQRTLAPVVTTYSFDGDAATDPTDTGAGFTAEGIQTGPFLRYQVMELPQLAADLQISKSNGVTSVVAGAPVTYTMTITNAGPDAVSGALFTDDVPAALTGVTWACTPLAACSSASGSGNSISLLLTLSSSATATLTVTGTLEPSAQGTLSNTAQIAAPTDTSDPTPANNSDTDSDSIVVVSDISVTKDDGVTTVAAGAAVTYTIVVANSGPSDAAAVTLSDALPAEVASATWTCAANGGATCPASGSGDINQTIGMPAGSSAVFTVSATVSPAARGTLSNTATVSAAGDPNTSNNTASDTDVITVSVDLALSKAATPSIAAPGDNITYTLTYTNAGPSATTGVTVGETVPANTTFAPAASTPGWTCVPDNSAGSACSFNAGALATGANGTLTFVVALDDPLPAGVLNVTNAATISGGDNDSDPSNNTDAVTTPIGAAPDLAISLDDQGATARPGGVITYTLTYQNLGNRNASGVMLTASVPDNTTFYAGASPGWSCVNGAPASTTCTLMVGALAAQATPASVSFAVIVNDPLAAGVTQITGTASIADDGANGSDPVPGNNTASETTPLAPTAIDLLYFRATQQRGHVVLTWATVAEQNIWGFHIYRSSDGVRAHAVRVTPALLPATGRGSGATYQWKDAEAGTYATYWLQEVELGGTTNEYGPVNTTSTPSAMPHTVFLPLTVR